MRIDSADLQFQRNATYGYDFAWRSPIQRGRWTDFVCHVKMSSNASVGFVELYVNTGSGFQQQLLKGQKRLYMKTMDASNGGGANNFRLNSYRKAGMFNVTSRSTTPSPRSVRASRRSLLTPTSRPQHRPRGRGNATRSAGDGPERPRGRRLSGWYRAGPAMSSLLAVVSHDRRVEVPSEELAALVRAHRHVRGPAEVLTRQSAGTGRASRGDRRARARPRPRAGEGDWLLAIGAVHAGRSRAPPIEALDGQFAAAALRRRARHARARQRPARHAVALRRRARRAHLRLDVARSRSPATWERARTRSAPACSCGRATSSVP